MPDRIRGRVTRVVDGDTVEMTFEDGTYKVRLWGVDAPESSQPYGPNATAGLRGIAEGQPAVLELEKTGPYGRLIGRVVAEDGEKRYDVGRALTLAGLAWADRKNGHSDRLAQLEAEARRKGKGLWEQDSPAPPWDWRSAPAPTASQEPGWGAVLFTLVVVAVLGLIAIAVGG